MKDPKREVEELRQEIAQLDGQLLTLIEKRGKASRRIGEVRHDQPASLPLGDRAAIRSLIAKANGEMPPEALRDIFREILAACLSLELPVKVAYAGPEGGPGHVAARGRFGTAQNQNLISCTSTMSALDEVIRRRAEFAVVPLETSTEGLVQSSIVALAATDLKIIEQVESVFDLHLMNRTGNAADIEKVYATTQDHMLCEDALANLGGSTRVSIFDVKSPIMACQLAQEDHGAAALTTEVFGAQVGLEVAKKNVLDRGADRVRYAVIGTRASTRTGNDVTAIIFSVPDSPGALLDALKQFAERGINLTKIQSRPMPDEAWTYMFFAEVSGHLTDRTIVTAFKEVKALTKSFKVLGSYPTLT